MLASVHRLGQLHIPVELRSRTMPLTALLDIESTSTRKCHEREIAILIFELEAWWKLLLKLRYLSESRQSRRGRVFPVVFVCLCPCRLKAVKGLEILISVLRRRAQSDGVLFDRVLAGHLRFKLNGGSCVVARIR